MKWSEKPHGEIVASYPQDCGQNIGWLFFYQQLTLAKVVMWMVMSSKNVFQSMLGGEK